MQAEPEILVLLGWSGVAQPQHPTTVRDSTPHAGLGRLTKRQGPTTRHAAVCLRPVSRLVGVSAKLGTWRT